MYTVLYVDDSAISRHVVEKILKPHYQVILASDGLEALKKGKAAHPDLVLTDLSMPGLNGFEVATRMKAMWPQVPVVALTSDDTEEARRLALIAGCNGRLIKPVAPQALLEAVEAYLRGAVETLPATQFAGETIAYQQQLVAHLETELLALSQANKQLATVNQIAQAVSQSLDLSQIIESGLDSLQAAIDLTYAVIFLYDDTTSSLTLSSARHLPSDYPANLDQHQRLHPFPASIQQAITSHEPHLSRAADPSSAAQYRLLTVMTLPLLDGNQLIGILEAAFKQDPIEDENRITLLKLVSQQLAQVINKGRLHREIHHQAEQLKRLNEAGRALTESLDLVEVLHKILPETTKVMDAEMALLELDDRLYEKLTAAGIGDIPTVGKPEGSTLPIVVRKFSPNSDSQSPDRARFEPNQAPLLPMTQDQYLLSTLLMINGQIIGRLQVINKRFGAFSKHDQQFLEALSLSAVGAIENARAHSALEGAYQELRHLDEMKDKFIQVANHELRTPLTLLKGYLMLMQENWMSAEEQGRAIDIAVEQINVLQELLSRILDFERLARDEFLVELVEANAIEVTRFIVSRFNLLAQSKQLTLQFEAVEALPLVWIDPAKYESILTNLISNAITFTPSGGTVEVKVSVQAERFAAAVYDNGIGIPATEHQRIFDRFYQVEAPLRRRHEGVGLGLAIARDMAELCGGEISLASSPGQGSIFTYSQPIKPDL